MRKKTMNDLLSSRLYDNTNFYDVFGEPFVQPTIHRSPVFADHLTNLSNG